MNDLRVVMFAHPRSGSTSLLDILNVHPELNLVEEPFHESFSIWHPDEKNYAALIEDRTTLDAQLSDIFSKYNGMKVLDYQLSYELYAYLLLKPWLKVIVLRRKNVLQAAVSVFIAKQTGIWNIRDLDPESGNSYYKLQAIPLLPPFLPSAFRPSSNQLICWLTA